MLLLLAGFALLKTAGDSKASGPATSAVSNEKYLYVWTGDQARKNADFLAVVNFDESSESYGTVITTVPLPAPGDTWNEPHHVGLSRDGKVLA
ncbi:MAG: selenium-binding family protein, partial [Acidobacteria bacterium]|nr:selenium-binding family protein [Acidobacteriota bacterium]